MSEYLTKEEIKQWRSSLEKITLEEYAKKLGKVLEEDTKTSDIIDIVMQNDKKSYMTREITSKPIIKLAQKSQETQDKILKSSKDSVLKNIKSKLNFKKPLTAREDAVLEHFATNQGKIVYAKDLATILNLPTDYVYTYIKNLRTKINEDILQNAAKGGYMFNYKI